MKTYWKYDWNNTTVDIYERDTVANTEQIIYANGERVDSDKSLLDNTIAQERKEYPYCTITRISKSDLFLELIWKYTGNMIRMMVVLLSMNGTT